MSHPLEEGFAGGAGYQEEYGTGGLIRCGNRYYNPYFGRFLTQDPAGEGTNWYAYCDNDPTTQSDPTGLFSQGGDSPYSDDFQGYSNGLSDDQNQGSSSSWRLD